MVGIYICKADKTMENPNDKNEKKSLLDYENSEEKSVLSFMGIELTAPSGLKSPILVYASFILVNFILLFVLKNLLLN